MGRDYLPIPKIPVKPKGAKIAMFNLAKFVKRLLFQYNQLVDAICYDWVARQWFIMGLLVGIGLSFIALWSFIAAAFLLIVILGMWLGVRAL